MNLLLRTIATGSGGNCHALIASTGEIFLLDLGENEKKIKKGIDWRISDVVGAVVTHRHSDHSKSVKDFERMGVPVFKPYDGMKDMDFRKKSGFKAQAFDLTTIDGRWTHTDADGEPCPCYGFIITHDEMGKMLYITDTGLVKWRFNGINHILLGVNYDQSKLSGEAAKMSHVLRGHMSIDTACNFVDVNKIDLQTVIMCHLSADNADADYFTKRMKTVVPDSRVVVAEKSVPIELKTEGV